MILATNGETFDFSLYGIECYVSGRGRTDVISTKILARNYPGIIVVQNTTAIRKTPGEEEYVYVMHHVLVTCSGLFAVTVLTRVRDTGAGHSGAGG